MRTRQIVFKFIHPDTSSFETEESQCLTFHHLCNVSLLQYTVLLSSDQSVVTPSWGNRGTGKSAVMGAKKNLLPGGSCMVTLQTVA